MWLPNILHWWNVWPWMALASKVLSSNTSLPILQLFIYHVSLWIQTACCSLKTAEANISTRAMWTSDACHQCRYIGINSMIKVYVNLHSILLCNIWEYKTATVSILLCHILLHQVKTCYVTCIMNNLLAFFKGLQGFIKLSTAKFKK